MNSCIDKQEAKALRWVSDYFFAREWKGHYGRLKNEMFHLNLNSLVKHAKRKLMIVHLRFMQ